MKPQTEQFINKHFGKFIWGLVLLCLIIGLLLVSSCSTPKYQSRKDARHAKQSAKLFNKSDNKSHATVADLCGQRFPPVASSDTAFIQGATVLQTDTLRSVDTVTINGIQYVNRYIDVYHTRVDTVRRNTVTVNNAALYAANDSNRHLKDQMNQYEVKLATMTQSRDGWRTKALWAIGVIAFAIIATIVGLYFKARAQIIKKIP